MIFSKPFTKISKNDSGIAGGKGASLGEMIQSDIPVPDGFVVLADTFEHFLDSMNLQLEIQTLLNDVDINTIHTIDSASEKIHYLIKNAEVPNEIVNEIEKSFTSLSAEYVAVRSSATAEDGAEHAWAGQLSSYLNVKEDTVVKKIQECWASLYTPRAIFYRFEKGLHDEKISVAVVVQKMVNSEKSGVAFSVHPVTENKNQIIIEAGLGLGEAIVSGEVTPDSYVVDKQSNKIIDCSVNAQTKGLFRSISDSEEGFNVWKDLSESEASSQVLTDDEIVTLSDLIQKIEKHYGFPCDIEWAYENQSFYITQSRPITTLGKSIQTPVIYEKVWEAGNAPVFEMTHGTYLAYSIQKEIGLVDKDMSVVGTKEKVSAYYSLDSLEQAGNDGSNFYMNCGKDFLKDAYTMVDEASIFVTKYEDEKVSIEIFELTSALLRRLFGYFNATNPQFTTKIEAEVRDEIEKIVGEGSEEVFRDMCLSEKLSLIQQEQIAWMELVTAVQQGSVDEKALVDAHYQQFKYLVGDEGNAAVTPDSLKALLQSELKDKIDYSKDLKKFYAYSDDSLQLKKKHTHEYCFSDELLKKTEILSEIGHVRLELRSAWTAVFHLIRKQLSELAKIYNLDTTVLTQYTADEKIERIKNNVPFVARPEEFSVTIEDDSCTLSFGSDAKQKEDFHVRSSISEDGSGVSGSTAFPGVVQGRVVVIEWGAEDFEEKLQNFPEGAILVAGQTRPMLVPAIKKASAIVTDEGGITSHAAIVAREFEKPCVIGTRSATEFFKDGDLVEVDATSGVVKVVKE